MRKVIDQNMVGHDIKKIMAIVRGIAFASKATRERVYANNADTKLSQSYRTELENNEKQALIDKARGQLSELIKLLADFRTREFEYDEILDIADPLLQGSLNIINTAGAEVTEADAYLMIRQLAGKRRALDVLKGAFDKVGVIVDEERDYFYNTQALCDSYDKVISDMIIDPYKAIVFGDAERASRKLIEVLGIDNCSDAELSCGWSKEDLVEATMIERAYLSPEDLKQAL